MYTLLRISCFIGKDQVTFGVVPLDDGCHSAQSAKSVMPLYIANCGEKRSVIIIYEF